MARIFSQSFVFQTRYIPQLCTHNTRHFAHRSLPLAPSLPPTIRTLITRGQHVCCVQNHHISNTRWHHSKSTKLKLLCIQNKEKWINQSEVWTPSLICIQNRTYSKKVSQQEIKPPGTVKMKVMEKYMSWVNRMETGLEKKWPKAYKLYMLVKIGMKDFYSDFKMWWRVAIDLKGGKKLSQFTRRELENYRQIPSDMLRVSPVLIISAFPFMNYVIFPIAYFFPRHLLCRQFWTPQQRVDFGQHYVIRRIQHYPRILQYMNSHVKTIKDQQHRQLFQHLMNKIERNLQLSAEEILATKSLFVEKPFGLGYLSRSHRIHLWHLAKNLNLSTTKLKLHDQALVLHHIDVAIHAEGLASLTMEELQQACFVRGFDAKGAKKEELESYLTSWVSVSRHLDEESLSLLLHCPVLLGYNIPANQGHLNLTLTEGQDP